MARLLMQYPEQLELKQRSIKDKCCVTIVKELDRRHTRRCKENKLNGENIAPLPPLLASRTSEQQKSTEGGVRGAQSGISKHCPFPVKQIIGSPCHQGSKGLGGISLTQCVLLGSLLSLNLLTALLEKWKI